MSQTDTDPDQPGPTYEHRIVTLAARHGLTVKDVAAVQAALADKVFFPAYTSDASILAALSAVSTASPELFARASPVTTRTDAATPIPGIDPAFAEWLGPARLRSLERLSGTEKISLHFQFEAFQKAGGRTPQQERADRQKAALLAKCDGDTSKLSAVDRMTYADLTGVQRRQAYPVSVGHVPLK